MVYSGKFVRLSKDINYLYKEAGFQLSFSNYLKMLKEYDMLKNTLADIDEMYDLLKSIILWIDHFSQIKTMNFDLKSSRENKRDYLNAFLQKRKNKVLNDKICLNDEELKKLTDYEFEINRQLKIFHIMFEHINYEFNSACTELSKADANID